MLHERDVSGNMLDDIPAAGQHTMTLVQQKQLKVSVAAAAQLSATIWLMMRHKLCISVVLHFVHKHNLELS